jgi:hypothetical protein
MRKHISLTIIGTILIGVCSCNSTQTVETLTSPVTESTDIEIAESSESSLETVLETEPVFTYETVEHTFPFSLSSMSNDEYQTLIGSILISDMGRATNYGFDNPYSLEQLRNYVYEQTGVYDDSITLTDVNYFSGSERIASYTEDYFTTLYGCEYCPYYYLEMVRAVLLTEGLRFGIDEIPYSYLERRFPQFMNEDFYGAPLLVSDIDAYTRPIQVPIYDYPEEYSHTYAFDRELLCSCLYYNTCRSSYIYNNPRGAEVTQVRDELTGRNILVPTESQYEQIMEDIQTLPHFENIDIYQVETRENFYDSYGIYPEDLLSEDFMYELNRTAVVQPNTSDDNT